MVDWESTERVVAVTSHGLPDTLFGIPLIETKDGPKTPKELIILKPGTIQRAPHQDEKPDVEFQVNGHTYSRHRGNWSAPGFSGWVNETVAELLDEIAVLRKENLK